MRHLRGISVPVPVPVPVSVSVSVFIFGFVWLALTCFASSAQAQEQKVLKVGVQLPLTGQRAGVGEIIKNGIEMAIMDLNREGGVDGALLQAVYEDDQDTRSGAVE
ncbi:MAG: ABC transporter substrate-binding protein, partial [candidate division NC10 bacterium]|nr:ABC transporter substrate-binding protein [candidate division NC10 bacterium]